MALKILIMSGGFYPDISPGSFRTTELVKELCRQGHQVTLYISPQNFDYSSFLKQYPVILKEFTPFFFKNIKIKGGSFEKLLRRIVHRFLRLLIDYPTIEYMFKVKKELKNERGYDLLISIAYPHPIHWGIAWVRSAGNPVAKTWIADCGDPYMGGRSDTFRKLFYFKFFEKWFCRKADLISIPWPEAIDAYYPQYHKKIKVIPHGFNFEEVKLAPYIQSESATFAFAGGITAYRYSATEFLKYLAEINIPFKFIIYVNVLGWTEPYIKSLGGKVIVRSYVPREKLLYELSKMDFLVNFGLINPRQRPSKLVDYALTKRPILNIGNPLDKKAVQSFLNRDYASQYFVKNIDQYNIKNVARQFTAEV